MAPVYGGVCLVDRGRGRKNKSTMIPNYRHLHRVLRLQNTLGLSTATTHGAHDDDNDDADVNDNGDGAYDAGDDEDAG